PMGGQVCLSLALYLYGDEAGAVAAREEPVWQAWLGRLFPMAGGFHSRSWGFGRCPAPGPLLTCVTSYRSSPGGVNESQDDRRCRRRRVRARRSPRRRCSTGNVARAKSDDGQDDEGRHTRSPAHDAHQDVGRVDLLDQVPDGPVAAVAGIPELGGRYRAHG